MRSQPVTKINLPDADWFGLQSPYVALFSLLSVSSRSGAVDKLLSAHKTRGILFVLLGAD